MTSNLRYSNTPNSPPFTDQVKALFSGWQTDNMEILKDIKVVTAPKV